MHLFGAIIIGLIAGWLAGKLIRGQGYGLLPDIVLGLIGAVVGQWIFDRMGIITYGSSAFSRWRRSARSLLIGGAHLLRGAAHS